MATKILHKRSSTPNTPPQPGAVSPGELVLNTADGKIYLKKDDGSVVDTSKQIFQRDTSISVSDDGLDLSQIVASVDDQPKVIIDVDGTTFTGPITVNNAETITLKDQNGDGYIAISAPDSVDYSYIVKLPPSLPIDQSVLTINGDGTSAWGRTDAFGGNRVYASDKYGDDNNDGINAPVRTIKRACQIAASLGQRPKVDPGEGFYNAKRLLEDNRAFIQEETIEFIEWNFVSFNSTYNEDKCKRDVGLIINAVLDDIILDTNFLSRQAGLAYLRAYSSKLTTTQKTRTIAGINRARDIANSLIDDVTMEGLITNRFAIVTTILNAGVPTAAPTLFYNAPTGVSQDVLDARNQLIANRDFISAEIIAFVNKNDPPEGIDTDICGRDAGLIVDAVIFDLLYGGNTASVEAASAYFEGTTLIIKGEEEIQKTVDAFKHLKLIIRDIIKDIAITPTSENSETQDTSNDPATDIEADIIDELIDIIITAIKENGGLPEIVNPNYSAGAGYASYDSFKTAILQEQTSIETGVIEFLNATYKTTYDEDKCRRDTGLIIDAVSYDLALGTNYNSVTAGLAYQRANAALVKNKQKIQTLGAITFAKGEAAASLVTNAGAVAASNSAFDEILDILDNGPEAADALTFTNPTGVNQDLVDAKNQLQQNRSFLRAEITSYIDQNFVGFRYSDTVKFKCERDLNLILEAVSYDLALGTNYNSVTAGLAYQRLNSAYVLSNQKIQTVAGILKAKELADLALVSDATAMARSADAFDEVVDILSNGIEEADALNFPSPVGVDANRVNAKDQLQANKEFIKAETIAWIDERISEGLGFWSGFVYDSTKCSRDVGYIVDALSYDILYGGNSATIINARAYYVGAAVSQLGIGEGQATVSAYEHLQLIISNIIQGIEIDVTTGNAETQDTSNDPATETESAITDSLIQIIKNVIIVGSTAQLPITIYPSLSWVDSGIIAARNNLVTQTSLIVGTTSSFIENAFDNFSYDSVKCSRDIGFIVDALSYDILYGGNSATIVNARSYYVGSVGQLGQGEEIITIYAYNYLKTLLDKVVQGIEVTELYQEEVEQVTSGGAATAGEVTILQDLVQIINDVIDEGDLENLPTVMYPSLVWVDSGILAARSQLVDDRPTIVNDTIQFIVDTYTGFDYNRSVCKRDAGLIVDSVIFDIILGGNSRSVKAGLSYYEFGNTSAAVVVADQKPETVEAIKFIKELSLAIIQNQDLGYTYQNLLTQKKYFSSPASSAAIIAASEKFDIVIDVLDSGDEPDEVILPSFDTIPITIQVSAGDFYIDNPIIVPDKVSITGDSLRSVVIRPLNANKDMFRVRNGAYIFGLTFRDGLDPATNIPIYTFKWAVAFDDPSDKSVDRSGYFGLSDQKPIITLSPYVQNCSIISFLGCNGVLVDGNKVETPNITPGIPQEQETPVNLLDGIPEQGKSMVANAFTMVSFGGTGWAVINDGYAQIVSCFQIFCLNGSYCQSGGYLSITNSATNFGIYALRASGYSSKSFEFDRGVIAATGTDGGVITITTVGTKRIPINQYVIKIIDAVTNTDITSTFKAPGDEVTFDAATAINYETGVFTINDHGYATGEGAYYSNNGNADIPGLLNDTLYFIQVLTTNTFKLFNDDSLTFPIEFEGTGTGTHKLVSNSEEFFIGDTVVSHSSYQKLILEGEGPYFFTPGQSIQGLTGGFTNNAFVYTYDDELKELIVSNEFTIVEGNPQRIPFNSSSTITQIGNTPASIPVDSIINLVNTYYTAISKVVSTVTGNQLLNPGNTILQKAHFHRPSIVNSSAHTWEFAGSGIDYNALPQNGGVGKGGIYEQYSELPGRVYTSGTNELGDFKVGDFIIAENKTGNITFRTRVTVGELNVLKLSLSDVEVSSISTDPGLGDNEPGGASNSRISVQRAIRTFIANRLGAVLDKQVSSNAVPGAVVQLNSQGQINADLLPPARGITTYNVLEWYGRLELSEKIPAIQVISGDNASESYQQQVLELDTAVQLDKFDIVTIVGKTGYGVIKEDMASPSTTITLANAVDDWDLTGNIRVNSSTLSPDVKVVTIGEPQNIIDNYFLIRDTTSQFLILSPGVVYDYTGITTVTGANSFAQGEITLGPIYGIAQSVNANTLFGGSGYTPGSGTTIYFKVPLLTQTGSGTGAKADITVSNGLVTAVQIVEGGSGYVAGDAVSANASDIGGTGSGFTVEILRADTRLYLNLLGSFIKFAATPTSPEFIEDANATSVTITELSDFVEKTFDARDVSLGGNVSYANSQITINSHGFIDGEAIVYGNGGNLVVGNLVNTRTYYVKAVDNNTIELYVNYAFTSGSKVLFGAATTGTHNFRRFTVDLNTGTIRLPNHGLTTAQPVRFSATTPPGGLINNSYYYIGSVTTNTITFHSNRSDALASVSGVTTGAILISSTGSGSADLTRQNVQVIGTVNTSSAIEANWAQVAQSTFDAANIVSGVINASRLAGVGSANNKTFLRGDSSWQFAVQNLRPATASPLNIVGDFFTQSGTDYYYNSLVLDVKKADDLEGNPNFTNFGVVAMAKAQFTTTLGEVVIKPGVVDAGLLGGQPGSYYTNPDNLIGSIPVTKGGTGLLTYTRGDLLYSGSNDSLTQLSIGAANSVLVSNGEIPSWSTSVSLAGNLVVGGTTSLNANTASTSTTTGALVVAGGVGIGGTIYAGGIQNTQIGTLTPSSGTFTTLSATGNVTLSGSNAVIAMNPTGTGTVTISPAGTLTLGTASASTNLIGNVNAVSADQTVNISPTGANGTVTINPSLAGNINNMNIGATTRGTGAFTTLTSNGATTFTANTASTSTGTGALVVTGGVGVGGALYAGSIQNTPIGSTTRNSGAFTTLTSNGATTFTASTASTSKTTGALVVTGGVGIGGDLYASNINASGTITHAGVTLTDGTNIDQIKTFNISMTLTTSWQDTTIKNTSLATGSYYVQIYANDVSVGGEHVDTYYSGIISWYAGTTSETTFEEIVLNRAGAAVGQGDLYVRLQRSSGSADNLRLQLAGSTINTGASTYTFKFRRLI